jgi:hypothetical protein
MNVSADHNGGTVTKTAPGVLPYPMQVNPASDGSTLTASIPAHVGDSLVLTAYSVNGLTNVSSPPGNSDSDSQSFTINVDVGN